MIGAILSFWHLSLALHAAMPVPCYLNAESKNVQGNRDIIKVVVSGHDDRRVRDPNANPDLEAAQGRVYCLDRQYKKSSIPSKDYLLSNGYTSNAVLVFTDDIILINRHQLKKKDGSSKAKVTNCYFEHLNSGDIIQMADAIYIENQGYRKGGDKSDNDIWEWHNDYALARLVSKPSGGKFIPRNKIVVDTIEDKNADITVYSNYAMNNPSGNPEDRTVTHCTRSGRFKIDGVRTNVISTPCDTGIGSSGAAAFLNGTNLFGIIAGQTDTPDGEEFKPLEHATFITRFDEKIYGLYDQLESRRSN